MRVEQGRRHRDTKTGEGHPVVILERSRSHPHSFRAARRRYGRDLRLSVCPPHPPPPAEGRPRGGAERTRWTRPSRDRHTTRHDRITAASRPRHCRVTRRPDGPGGRAPSRHALPTQVPSPLSTWRLARTECTRQKAPGLTVSPRLGSSQY